MNGKEIWLSNQISNCQPFEGNADEYRLIRALLDEVDRLRDDGNDSIYDLASAFDILVSAAYYGSVAHAGWIYCPESTLGPVIFYPYTNVCPSCAVRNKFAFHKANKPKSGVIGAHTARLLALFIQEALIRKKSEVKVFRGSEPVDVIFVDQATEPVTVMFAEVKASPLFTLPLLLASQTLTTETEFGLKNTSHHKTDNLLLFKTDLKIYLPFFDEKKGEWREKAYSIGSKGDRQDLNWAYKGLVDVLNGEPEFFKNFVSTWRQAFDSYAQRNQDAIYWLTNACGQPSPRPEDWPRRKGSGYESISDGKTSVGMDRTDDLKKATYQVLKIGAEGRPTKSYSLKVGIISNIHAVRHFDDYLAAFKNIVWTRDETGKVKLAKDLPPDAEIYNLFDGIITLTQLFARDEWIKRTFDFVR